MSHVLNKRSLRKEGVLHWGMRLKKRSLLCFFSSQLLDGGLGDGDVVEDVLLPRDGHGRGAELRTGRPRGQLSKWEKRAVLLTHGMRSSIAKVTRN